MTAFLIKIAEAIGWKIISGLASDLWEWGKRAISKWFLKSKEEKALTEYTDKISVPTETREERQKDEDKFINS